MPASAIWRHFSEAHAGGARLRQLARRAFKCNYFPPGGVQICKNSPLARPKQISRLAANTPYYIIVAYGTFTYVLTALLTEQRFGPKCFAFTDA